MSVAHSLSGWFTGDLRAASQRPDFSAGTQRGLGGFLLGLSVGAAAVIVATGMELTTPMAFGPLVMSPLMLVAGLYVLGRYSIRLSNSKKGTLHKVAKDVLGTHGGGLAGWIGYNAALFCVVAPLVGFASGSLMLAGILFAATRIWGSALLHQGLEKLGAPKRPVHDDDDDDALAGAHII